MLKSSNFYAPSKPSFQWFATAHWESGESQSSDVKLRTNASVVPVRSPFCTGVGAILPHKLFVGTPQTKDFCF